MRQFGQRPPEDSASPVGQCVGTGQGGIQTPSQRKPLASDFLVKKRNGSFGVDLHGPFNARTWDFSQVLADEAYYEQFISGRSVKAWCWNGQVVALELIESPYLVGDGLRSLQQLAAQRGNVGRALPLEKAVVMLAWQGLTAESMPDSGKKVLLDFKYVTPFDSPVYENRNVWREQGQSVRHQLAKAVFLLGNCVPPQLRGKLLFTLDAVLDGQGHVWFLEMNSHPMIHPDMYEPMLTTLMKPA